MLRKGNQGKRSEPILSDLQLTGAVNRSGSLESQDTGAEPPEGEARAIHCDEAEYLQFPGSTSPLRVEHQHFGGYSSSSSLACEAEAISDRCLQVILEHEEEAASLSPAILLQRLKEVQSGRQGDALYPNDYASADCPRVDQISTRNEGPQTSQPVDDVAFDVDRTTFRCKPHVESEPSRSETQQDSQVQEQVSVQQHLRRQCIKVAMANLHAGASAPKRGLSFIKRAPAEVLGKHGALFVLRLAPL